MSVKYFSTIGWVGSKEKTISLNLHPEMSETASFSKDFPSPDFAEDNTSVYFDCPANKDSLIYVKLGFCW